MAFDLLTCSYSGANLIAQSQNGSGKTAAFVLGMLSRLDRSVKVPQALCLAPTRELAVQIAKVTADLGQFTDIKVGLGVNGVTLGMLADALLSFILGSAPSSCVFMFLSAFCLIVAV